MLVYSTNDLKLNIVQVVSWIAVLLFPEPTAIRIQYFIRFRRILNLKKPVTYTEKIQFRKLNERDPRMPNLVDKIRVKSFVKEQLREDWIVPTLWSGKELPEQSQRNWPLPYVIKASHGCGWNIFVLRPEDQNWYLIEKTCEKWSTSRY